MAISCNSHSLNLHTTKLLNQTKQNLEKEIYKTTDVTFQSNSFFVYNLKEIKDQVLKLFQVNVNFHFKELQILKESDIFETKENQ